MDETTLIQRAINGEAAAWEPLMLAHQEPVFRFAYLFLGDADDAEDITQETFLRAYHNLKRFDPTRPLRPWLLSIAANLAKNRHRTAARYLAALTRSFRADPPAAVRCRARYREGYGCRSPLESRATIKCRRPTDHLFTLLSRPVNC